MGNDHFKDRLSFFAAIFALMLAAANLRGGLVVIGPLVENIRTDLGISAAAFGFLMTLPLLCFASFSLVVPWVANRLAPMKVVALALLILAVRINVGERPIMDQPVGIFKVVTKH